MVEEQSVKSPYRVLARKYRPRNFDELIGQDALVRTLKNAIESGRIAQAYMLTGIRGTGKTTTARIIARALNYTGPDGQAGPTTGPTDDCEIARAIAEDRHPDVMEMDAASRTGVDDIREILDGVRYAPTSARYKVYIIDEVHMLSRQAFNALLKTLEEPPPHVIFIFATTEIRKVPVTVLSRCQRFDLRRIDAGTLADYYGTVCEKEGVTADPDALALIGRAADGSARDGMSILDQAIAMGSGTVTLAQVRDMLGLADRNRIMDLLAKALKGECPDALEIMADLYRGGADPIVVMQDLLDLTHILTRLRAVPSSKDLAAAMTPDALAAAKELAAALSMPSLGRAWQILLKGLSEVAVAPNAQAAAEMVIIRLAYTADLPDPSDLIRKLKKGEAEGYGGAGGLGASSAAPTASERAPEPVALRMIQGGGGRAQAVQAAPPQPAPQPLPQPIAIPQDAPVEIAARASYAATDLKTLALVDEALRAYGHMVLASEMYQYVHAVRLEAGRLEISQEPQARPGLGHDIAKALTEITGARWVATILPGIQGEPTLAQQAAAAQQALVEKAQAHPLVGKVLEIFPGAALHVTQQKDGERAA